MFVRSLISFFAVNSNSSNVAVRALRLARLVSIFLTEFSIVSSLLGLVRIDFSCSEMSPIFSSASMTVSSSSTCTSSLIFLRSGEVDVSSPELEEDL